MVFISQYQWVLQMVLHPKILMTVETQEPNIQELQELVVAIGTLIPLQTITGGLLLEDINAI